MGAAELAKTLEEFNMGIKTGIDLPGESSGITMKWKIWGLWSCHLFFRPDVYLYDDPGEHGDLCSGERGILL